MSYWDEQDARKEGRDDFRNRGAYGYDHERYYDRASDDGRAYRNGFDEARREEERRQEERDEEEAAEKRAAQRRREAEREYEEEQERQQPWPPAWPPEEEVT
ncbi:MAG: hypothetical protein HY323_03475 [Betaproteobacteria bacterium]|nr:hypothetical protein [Betaproteobacteria bacterium]